MAKLFNRVRMTVNGTPGTGTITLNDAYSIAYCSFAEAGVVNGDVVSYFIDDGNNFEIGFGTYTSSGTTLSRDTVRLSKIAGVVGTTRLTLTSSAIVYLSPAKEDLDGPISILSYGAVPNDATKYVINQAAITAALATGIPIYVPAGKLFYTQPITIPSNAHSIFGLGTLVAAGTVAASALLSGTSLSNIILRDFSVQIDAVAYTTLDGIDLTGCTDSLIQGIIGNGYNGILTTNCVRPRIVGCHISDFNNIGIVDRGGTDVEIARNNVNTTNTTTSNYGIQGSAIDGIDVSHNWVSNAFSFGVVISGLDSAPYTSSKRATIFANHVENVGLEGVNVANVTDFAIVGNVCRWTNGSSRDFGISAFGDPNTTPVGLCQRGTISGNVIYAPGKAGIALANNCVGVAVSGNTIYDANKLNGATVYHTSGILFYGRGSLNNKAVGNNIIDPLSHLTWGTNEFDDGIGAGAGPNFNSFTENSGAGSSGSANIVGASSSAGNKIPIYISSQTGVGGAGATQFFVVGGSATELNIYGVAPATGTFRNLYLNLNTAPGGVQTDTFTLRVNGADTAITFVVTGAAVSGSDLTHAVPVTKGQTWSIKIVGSAAAAATIVNGGIELDTY